MNVAPVIGDVVNPTLRRRRERRYRARGFPEELYLLPTGVDTAGPPTFSTMRSIYASGGRIDMEVAGGKEADHRAGHSIGISDDELDNIWDRSTGATRAAREGPA
jgi:hypothetical protein